MSSEILYVETYSCPHCRAELEARHHEWQGWLRCAACGLPSLPPLPTGVRFPRGSATRSQAADDVLLISDSPDLLAGADPVMPASAGPSQISPARLVFRTGLLVSLGLMVIFFLDQNTTNTTIFGCLAVLFFLLLLRLPASRSPAA